MLIRQIFIVHFVIIIINIIIIYSFISFQS